MDVDRRACRGRWRDEASTSSHSNRPSPAAAPLQSLRLTSHFTSPSLSPLVPTKVGDWLALCSACHPFSWLCSWCRSVPTRSARFSLFPSECPLSRRRRLPHTRRSCSNYSNASIRNQQAETELPRSRQPPRPPTSPTASAIRSASWSPLPVPSSSRCSTRLCPSPNSSIS